MTNLSLPNRLLLALSLGFLILSMQTLAWAKSEPPAVDEAFHFSVKGQTSNSITLSWKIANGYYLYKDRIHISATPAEQILLGRFILPDGLEKYDEILGHYEAYSQQLELTLPIDVQPGATFSNLQLQVQYQGCAENGYCYPPMAKTMNWPETGKMVDVTTVTAQALVTPTESGNIQAENILASHEFWLILSTFFGFGILLAFTPCVLPMLPILSGVILGHGKHLSHSKAFVLASFYVLGMALTYALLGVLASLAGQQLQSLLQTPWIIGVFSALFVGLALSLFGFYELRMPSSIQNKLNKLSQQQHAGHIISVMIMGVLSALLVSPCITPPLIGALTYMGNSGNMWLGGSALFAMGMGMGMPLILFVTVGSKMLPKSGPWMLHIERFFGVILLAVAIWLLERILPAPITLVLWGALLLLISVLLGTFRNVHPHWCSYMAKTVGIIAFAYSVILFTAGSLGQTDPLRPLHQMQKVKIYPFQRIKSVDDLQAALDTAKLQRKPLILDFYADWCVACKKMDKHTFSKPDVVQALQNCFIAIQADITRVDKVDRALQSHLSVVAPPTLIFFNQDGDELSQFRVVGEMDMPTLLTHLKKMTGGAC